MKRMFRPVEIVSTSCMNQTLYKRRMYFKIYRNLHRGNFSIQHWIGKGGYRVKDRASSLLLHNCHFRVSEAGRQKVIQEKRKNVHAYIEPTSYSKLTGAVKVEGLREIYYNPYKYGSFVYKDTKEAVEDIEQVLAHDNKLYDVTGNTLQDFSIY